MGGFDIVEQLGSFSEIHDDVLPNLCHGIPFPRCELLAIDSLAVQGEHLQRALGCIVGSQGKTKYAIENATTTRMVVAGMKIYIFGEFRNTRMAREAVASLSFGRTPGRVYQDLRSIAGKVKAGRF
jgi:rRNA processing protein Krr1/Pno1